MGVHFMSMHGLVQDCGISIAIALEIAVLHTAIYR